MTARRCNFLQTKIGEGAGYKTTKESPNYQKESLHVMEKVDKEVNSRN